MWYPQAVCQTSDLEILPMLTYTFSQPLPYLPCLQWSWLYLNLETVLNLLANLVQDYKEKKSINVENTLKKQNKLREKCVYSH